MSDKDLFKKADEDLRAGRLEEAREAIITAVKKKPKPEYEKKQNEIDAALADREAAKGEKACNDGDLKACEQQIAAAKAYMRTPRVNQLEASYKRIVDGLRQRYESALKQAESENLEDSLRELNALVAYSVVLPNVNSEIKRVTDLLIQKLLAEGNGLIEAQRWEDASVRFQRVLQLNSENQKAKAGLNTLDLGRQGYEFHTVAMKQFADGDFEGALKSIESAIRKYASAKDFENAKNKIIQGLVRHLLSNVPTLLESQSDFARTRDAYLQLLRVRELDPSNAEVPKHLDTAASYFGANSLERAQKLEDIVTYSQIGTAAVLKMDGDHLRPGEVKPEELKNLIAPFNRKRVAQLLLSVNNLCGAPQNFLQTVLTRARSRLEGFGYPDLRIRMIEDYEKSPNEDPQFQDLRPDGKSSTVELRIGVSNHESERRYAEVPEEVRSYYNAGMEQVRNPEHDQLLQKLDTVRTAVNRRTKKDKPTLEGWDEGTVRQLESELQKTEKYLQKEKRVEYKYQKIGVKQQTKVAFEIILRDHVSRADIASDKVSDDSGELVAVEITNVKDSDVTGAQNQQVRLRDKDQALREAERKVLDSLDNKINGLLPSYTDRFYNEGERALKSNRIEDAVEAFICHWAFLRGKLDPVQSERVIEIVKRETGFDLAKNGDGLLKLMMVTVPSTP